MAMRDSGRHEWNRDRDRQREPRWQGQSDEGRGDEGRYQQEGYGQYGYGQYEGDYYGGRGRRYQGGGAGDFRSDYGGEGQRYSGGFYTGESGAGAYDQYGDRGAQFGDQRSQYGQYGQQGQGQQNRGRGPKGYQRSDERIREDVCECLTHDPQVDASNLEVSVKNCEVTLSGTVNSREDKRRAADLAEYVSGVKDVHNNLRVSEQSGGGTLGTQQGTTGQTQSPRH